jgi:hypothetical protein
VEFSLNPTNKVLHFLSASLLIVLLLLGGGCQSSLDIAGDEHKTVTEKWRALSKYAESSIENYDVTISARLAISTDKRFKLTHFKISSGSNKQDINLLTPNFENKYICSPLCYQLIEYVNFSGESGTTLLTSYFDRHEFELFKFYGDIQLLNKQLAKLAKHDQALLNSYLKSMAYQSVSFDTAKGFIQFLTEALTIPSLKSFADNPQDLLSHYLKKHQVKNASRWNTADAERYEWTDISKEQNEWSADNREQSEWSAKTQEQNEWSANSQEQNEWSTYSQEQNEWSDIDEEKNEWASATQEQNEWTMLNKMPERVWLNESDSFSEAPWLKQLPKESAAKDGVESVTNDQTGNDLLTWGSAKASLIKIGHNVCSYQGSFFGVVTAISFDKVTVNVLGQAKRIIEGIIYPANDGDLFSMNENLYFTPLSERKSFERSNVASCLLE